MWSLQDLLAVRGIYGLTEERVVVELYTRWGGLAR